MMTPDDSRNPKKARRHDEEPSNIGRSLPSTTNPSLPSHPLSPTSQRQPMSYKDSLLGESKDKPSQGDSFVEDDDIEILDGEVTRSVVDGMISIQFSKRIQALAAKSMDRTIILKLLGRRIGYETLKTKIHDLWKPASEIKLMDIENGYFLATFRSHNDFLTVLADGPWTIFGHYLTVEPWLPDFSPSQPFPSKVVAWIRLPGLPATLYKRSLIEEIVSTPPVPSPPHDAASAAFGPWMLVEKRQRCPARKPHNNDTQQQVEVPGGSRFNPLRTKEEEAVETGVAPAADQADISRPRNPRIVNKGKQVVAAKQLRAVSVRKPLSTSLTDFPIIPRSSFKANSSRGTRASNPVTILDKNRHSAIVLSENSDPNLPLVAVSRSHPASSSNIHTSGDPPDVDMVLSPRMDRGDASHESIPPVGVQNASHEAAMLD
ncbi:hypothetical protein V6N11_035297 [Hibiscus sabdariffa]|uniref:DUF4283 domain-containing protein n=1 Tax=Hibiscus sabdariffa TaxID=183260 RepID=A0ABR2QZY2_9ROSI